MKDSMMNVSPLRRKIVTLMLACSVVCQPLAASADGGFQYFRMYGGGTAGMGAPAGPGALTYFVAGSSSASVGDSYAAAPQVAGAAGAVTFTLQSGQLAPGLSLDPSSGIVSGLLTTAGGYDAVLKVADANGSTGFGTLHLVVTPQLQVGWTPARGVVGETYADSQPVPVGGTAPYSYTLSGTLPPGLVFSQSTGSLSGVPQSAGDYPLSVTAMDAAGRTATTGMKTLTVDPAAAPPESGPLALTGTPPALAQVGVGYVAHFTGTAGTAPYSYDMAQGTLPDGLSLAPSDGTISGVPTAAGTVTGLQVRVTDAANATAVSGVFSINVQPMPALLLSGTPAGTATVGQSYLATFTAFDGSGSGYSFVSTGNALPPGLSLSTINGTQAQISGVPATAGTYSGLEIQVTDSVGQIASSGAFQIVVTGGRSTPLAVASGPSGTVIGETGFSFLYPTPVVLQGLVGTASYSLLRDGNPVADLSSVCSGLNFNGVTGAITGVPSAPCDVSGLRLQVTDSFDGSNANGSIFALAVVVGLDPVANSSEPVPHGVVGIPYSHSVASWFSGGVLPYTMMQVSDHPLPDGLTLSADGTISGTPTSVFSSDTIMPQIEVMDAAGYARVYAMPMTVDAPVATLTPAQSVVRSGYSFGGTLSTNVTGSSWSFAQTPPSPSLSMSASGTSYSGTAPAVASATSFSIVGAIGSATATAVSLTVQPPLAVSGGPAGALQTMSGTALPANPSYVVTGLVGAGTWTLLKDGNVYTTLSSVCPGLTFSGTDGALSGTPTTVCSVSGLQARLTDSFDSSAVTGSSFSITVAAPLLFSGTPPVATQGTAYSYSMTDLTSGGTAPYTYTITSGALPSGLTLGADGTVSGTPDGTAATTSPTVQVADAAGQTASQAMTFTVLAGSNFYSWGYSLNGQLGNGTTAQMLLPTQGVGGLTLSKLSVGSTSTCALDSVGTGYCWGANNYGQLGNGQTVSQSAPVSVTVVAGPLTAIVTSGSHTCAIKSGALYCWGFNSQGQLGDNKTVNRVTAAVVSNMASGVTSVALAGTSTCAIKSGALYCWGNNYYGQLGDGTTVAKSVPTQVSGLTSGVSSVASGPTGSTCAIQSGSLKCWGDNSYGKLGNGSTAAATTPAQVSGFTSGVTMVSAGVVSSCALKSGAMYCWGYNGFGEVGSGNASTGNLTTPQAVSNMGSGVTAMSVGTDTACAVKSGQVYCWGYNADGLLGNGTTDSSRHSTPVVVSGMTGKTEVGISQDVVTVR